MTKKILFTGGSGLLSLGWSVSIKDKFNVVLGLHNRNIKLANTSSQFIDLGLIDSLTSVIEDINPDVVIHTAALTNVEQCERDPELAHYVNVSLSVNVAKACQKLHAPLVHISTDHIFSGKLSLLDETAVPSPINIYAQTKAEAELKVLDINPTALVLRSNFYGWGTSYRSSFSDIIFYSLTKKKQIVLFDNIYYTPILIQSLADTVEELLNNQINGIVHVVGDEKISKYKFGIKLAQRFNLDSDFIRSGRLEENSTLVQRPYDMSLSNLNVRKLLNRDLGTVEDGLEFLFHQKKSGIYQELKEL